MRPSPVRADGIEARQRLVGTALKLFARQGYERTSTRQICDEAAVNISAIAYYFGDKAALYRAAFFEPIGDLPECVEPIDPATPLREAFSQYYRELLKPLELGDLVQDCMRLHFREFVDPTGLWNEHLEREFIPQHHALAAYLTHYLGEEQADVPLHTLVVALVGMGVQMFIGRDLITAIEPDVLRDPTAIADHLAELAEGMVLAEAKRRRETRARKTKGKS